LLACIVIPWTVIRWGLHQRRQRRPATLPVGIVADAAMPAPSLPDAYRALPPHCRGMLETRK